MPEAESLAYFEHVPAKVADTAVTLSRTGYTGDLGFEITVAADHAVDVLDAVLEAGRPHGIRPFGEEALMMLRIEAGLPLIDVEWHNSRLAFTDDDRVTPKELGMGWMLRGVRDGSAPSSGPRRSGASSSTGTSRWATVGIVVDWQRGTGSTATPACSRRSTSTRCPTSRWCYDDDRVAGRLRTSFIYSPVLQRHIGLARVRPDLAAGRHRRAARARDRPPQHHGPGHHDRDALLQPRPEERMSEEGMSSSHDFDAIVVGGGHNGLTNAATSPRRGCARWCSSSGTSSAAPRSPRSCCPASRSRRSPTR